jgi:hypothetical protein
MANSALLAIGVIVIVVIIIGAVVVLMGKTTYPTIPISAPTSSSSVYTTTLGSSAQTQQTPIMMTDPPHVPMGTSALIITYSSVMVYTNGTNGSSGWVDTSGNGSANLMALSGVGQTLATATVAANSSISAVAFTITSAQITVNGTTYNVSIPSGTNIMAQVVGNTQVNQSAGVLVDLTPTVSVMVQNNATTFAVTPSSKAIVTTTTNTSVQVGATVSLSAGAYVQLLAATPDIVITSANISTSGNTTTTSITVQDQSNSSVTLNNVQVYGQQNVSSSSGGLLGGLFGTLGLQIQSLGVLNFVIGSSGSLSIPNSNASFSGSGYVLTPGSSTTLVYSGTALYGGSVVSTPVVGSSYDIVVTGSDNAQASSAVNAT